MSTLVFLHAHPDDESSQTAGMMYRAARRGHRVVLLIATDGRHGTPPASGEDIVDYRRGEVEASALGLGIEPPRWLGFHDSGMLGDETNADPRAFASASVPEVAEQVARVLDDVGADVLVAYDHHGGYGHPDHVQAHLVAAAAADLAGPDLRFLICSNDSTAFARMAADPEMRAILEEETPELAAAFAEIDPEEFGRGSDGEPVGLDPSDLRWRITLTEDEIAAKRAAMACHASQTSDIGFMLALPPRVFAAQFGLEYLTTPEYIEARGTVGPPAEGWPFDETGRPGTGEAGTD